MPGPAKTRGVRVKVQLEPELAAKLNAAALLADCSQSELLRGALIEYLKPRKQRTKGPPIEKHHEIDIVWSVYIQARARWWKLFRSKNAPGKPTLTPERRKLIGDAIKHSGIEATKLAAKGVWLSDFHTERKITAPEYAFRRSNIERFASIVAEERHIEAKRKDGAHRGGENRGFGDAIRRIDQGQAQNRQGST